MPPAAVAWSPRNRYLPYPVISPERDAKRARFVSESQQDAFVHLNDDYAYEQETSSSDESEGEMSSDDESEREASPCGAKKSSSSPVRWSQLETEYLIYGLALFGRRRSTFKLIRRWAGHVLAGRTADSLKHRWQLIRSTEEWAWSARNPLPPFLPTDPPIEGLPTELPSPAVQSSRHRSSTDIAVGGHPMQRSDNSRPYHRSQLVFDPWHVPDSWEGADYMALTPSLERSEMAPQQEHQEQKMLQSLPWVLSMVENSCKPGGSEYPLTGYL